MEHNSSNGHTIDSINLFSSRAVKLLLKMNSTVLAEELSDGSHKILGIEQVKRDDVTSWILHTDMNVEIHENIPITQDCWADNQMQLIERVATKALSNNNLIFLRCNLIVPFPMKAVF